MRRRPSGTARHLGGAVEALQSRVKRKGMITQMAAAPPEASLPGVHLQPWMAAQMALLARSGIPGVISWNRLGAPSLPTANLTVMVLPAMRSRTSSGMRTARCTHPCSAICGLAYPLEA